MTDREDKIRERAYGIWEEEGHPHGRAEHHWQRAAREVVEPPVPVSAAPAPKPAPKRRKAATGAVAAPKRTATKRTPKKS
jgi:hypothetical protein